MNPYSLERDRLFRSIYTNVKLSILSREEYSDIKRDYAPLIENWEY